MNLTLKNKFTASTRFWFTLSNSCCCLSFVLFFVFYYTQLHAQYYCVRPGHDSHYWDHTLLLSKRAQPGKHCYCRWPGPVAAVIQWNSTNIKAKSFLPGNSWNVLFLPRSLVSLCLPLTWQVLEVLRLRLMVPSFGSMQISSLSCPPHTQITQRWADCHLSPLVPQSSVTDADGDSAGAFSRS